MATIVCADDDILIQQYYERLFSGQGYDVQVFGNGAEVLDSITHQRPDLLILDINMPDPDGLTVCHEIRARTDDRGNIPIILVSGVGDQQTIEQGLTGGADDYILKPFQTPELLAKARFYMNRVRPLSSTTAVENPDLVGQYRLLKQLGVGGYSTVYLAEDEQDENRRKVALKLYDLPPYRRSDSRYIAMVLREAYQLSKLNHPNIVTLYNFGNAGSFFYLAMEYVDAWSLESFVENNGAMDARQLGFVLYEITRVLEYLDQQRVLHRDIKPSNILMSKTGAVKIADFGLARQQNEHTLSLTDEFKGTPQYVCPEYILGEELKDISSDIYSLGATAYYAALASPPFPGDSPLEVLNNHLAYVPPPIIELRPDFEPELSTLIDQMMATLPEDRCDIPYILETLNNVFRFA